MTESARFGWTVLLPVKVLAQAKSRLAVLAGERRHELALALASDTVSAVVACPEVARVIVVTSDPVAGPRLSSLGARIIPEARRRARPRQPATPRGRARTAASTCSTRRCCAARRWRSRRWPGTGLAALTADLPALRPAELAEALRAVSDAAGAGVRAGRRRRGHDDVRGRAGRGVPADVRRGVPGATCRRRCHRARARWHRRTASGRGYAGRPAGSGCAWGRTADRRGRGGAPRRRVKARAGARASAAAQIRTTGQVRVLVIPSTA